eukprot:gene12038-biopygen380
MTPFLSPYGPVTSAFVSPWLPAGTTPTTQGGTTADADQTRAGRGPHHICQRNGRGPDAGSAVSPTTIGSRFRIQ